MNLLSSLFGPSLPSLNVSELSEKLKGDKQAVVLDVRQPEEYREGHIAGSKLIPLRELTKRVNELPKNKEIICVCASGSILTTVTNCGFELKLFGNLVRLANDHPTSTYAREFERNSLSSL